MFLPFVRRRNLRCALRCLCLILPFACAPGAALARGRASNRAAVVPAAEPAAQQSCRAGDELWLVSTRHLGWPACDHNAPPNLQVMRYDDRGGWRQGNEGELRAQRDPRQVTMLFVHGYRCPEELAFGKGRSFYSALVGCDAHAPPVRLIVWSWPSDPTQRLLRDARAKARRTDAEAYYLAKFLAQLDPDVKLSLAGFSYGARVITGALHLRGGGELCGLRVEKNTSRTQARAVLFAPAMHSGWLAPGEYHAMAYSQLDRLLVLYSPCDWVLKHYHWVDRCTRAEALGYTGLAGRERFPDAARRIAELNAAGYIGSSHEEDAYIHSPELAAAIRKYLLWRPVE